ncbi:hypothetical protein [Xylophilus sp. GOD-11R]|uniref:NHL domain-containing protein n=1 Tax=Xylophilus sp. GOD-11R TaxID=3089814 RepID=UPI00298CE432|nr:hypothetical protein [Xylophilus sp. GOD-11R]WPB55582.1 hypothetical protein R9X41_15700 [Xylophilus sp. GOD-11R]
MTNFARLTFPERRAIGRWQGLVIALSRWLPPPHACRTLAAALCMALASCGGSNDPAAGGDTPPPVVAPGGGGSPGEVDVAPAITTQPAGTTVVEGQVAAFSVTATGTAPLSYQWQRNGSAIAGATAATYTLAAAASTDSGAIFRAVVSNAAGNATSDNATLTVTPAATPPVLSLSAQPSSQSASAGTTASFTVAGGCSARNFTVQWQRGSGGVFADIAGATATTYSMAPASSDNGAQFRAQVSCGGLSATTSAVATLSVTAAVAATLARVPVSGVRDQAIVDQPNGIVREASGSYAFVAGSTVRRLSADLSTITLVAGAVNDLATIDGVGTAARFNAPSSIAADASGNLFVTEPTARVVRRIAPDGTVTTIAGTPYAAAGRADGIGGAASFNLPIALAAGPDGDLYVADTGNYAIRRVTPAGVVTTYAGNPAAGFGYQDGPAASARFHVVYGVAVAGDNTVYVADTGNRYLRRITRVGNAAGVVQTVAGGGPSNANVTVDGPAGAGTFLNLRGMTVDGNTLYARDLDAFSGLIRAVDLTTGTVRTLAGSRGAPPTPSPTALIDGPPGTGFIGGSETGGVAAIGDGRVVFTDFNNGALRVAAADGYLTTIAHEAWFNTSHPDGNGVLAQLPPRLVNLSQIGASPDGSLVLAEQTTVRRLAADGRITPLIGLPGAVNNLDGRDNIAQVAAGGQAVTVAADGTIYFADLHDVRRLDPATRTVASLAGSKSVSGTANGAAAAARFQGVQSLAVGPGGAVFVADQFNSAIRRIDPAGNVSTFAGELGSLGAEDGPRGTARLSLPASIAFTPDGTLWVIDDAQPYATVRRVAPDGSVSTLATSGTFLNRGSTRIVIDPAGNIFLTTSEGIFGLAPDTGVLTQLIPTVQTGIVYGNDPKLVPGIRSAVATGVKQLVMINDDQLVRATLP